MTLKKNHPNGGCVTFLSIFFRKRIGWGLNLYVAKSVRFEPPRPQPVFDHLYPVC
jgi:hypothetical protein